MRQMLRRNARPPVQDLEEYAVTVPTDANGDVAATVIERIAHQVGDHTFEPTRIAHDHDFLRIDMDTCFPSARTHDGRGERSEVDSLGPHTLPVRVEAGDLHQLFDQPPQTGDVRNEQLCRPPRLGRHPLEVLGQ